MFNKAGTQSKLCFATNNPYKIAEVSKILGKYFKIVSLKDIGCFEEIPETRDTLEGNSLEKAEYVFNRYKMPCFTDDTGLEVEALNGQPGVHSARYAGSQKSSEDNISLLLIKLKGTQNRRARFRTVITLFLDHNFIQFEGIVHGRIIDQKRGENGFGYDPVFIPEGSRKTFAQLTLIEKNRISHRGIAFRKLGHYLQQKTG